MKTKIKSIVFAVFMLAIIAISSKVQAASANIGATKTTATVGDSVTITVNINAAAWNLKVTGNGVSGGSIVGYDPDGVNTSTSKTYALNTASAGTYTIYLTGDVTDGSTDVNSGVSTSVTVTVKNPEPVTPSNPPTNTGGSSTGSSSNNSGSSNNKPSTGGSSNSNTGSSNNKPTTKPEEEKKSNDATLKSLVVEGYELYPEFNANTREYNVTVTNDITKVTILPTVNHQKASYKIQGIEEELQVGKNVVTIVVTAEDGTTGNYIVNVNRQREGLNVTSIKVSYLDEAGTKKELLLNPTFAVDIFEYTLEDISYLVSKLDIEVIANLEEATIEILGNENLVEGSNTITITVTMPSESEELEDEVLKYTIIVNKQKEPVLTLMGRIKNWFNGITGTVGAWYGENQYNIIMGALIVCVVSLIGLSIYMVIDYKKYRLIVEKIAEITRINNATITKANESINAQEQVIENKEKDLEEKNDKGRHF